MAPQRKVIKGVIEEWSFYEGRVHGICSWHADYSNGIEQGKMMTTSPVVSIHPRPGSKCKTLETENSLYLLT